MERECLCYYGSILLMEIGTGNTRRGNETKTLVVVATECIGKQIGRVRFRCINEATSENLTEWHRQYFFEMTDSHLFSALLIQVYVKYTITNQGFCERMEINTKEFTVFSCKSYFYVLYLL